MENPFQIVYRIIDVWGRDRPTASLTTLEEVGKMVCEESGVSDPRQQARIISLALRRS